MQITRRAIYFLAFLLTATILANSAYSEDSNLFYPADSNQLIIPQEAFSIFTTDTNWFATYVQSIEFTDQNTYTITWKTDDLNEISHALDIIGIASTYVSTASGCEAYYGQGGTGYYSYTAKVCGTSSTWRQSTVAWVTGSNYCDSQFEIKYYDPTLFEEVVSAMCSSCSFRQTTANNMYSRCANPMCCTNSNGSKYSMTNLVLPGTASGYPGYNDCSTYTGKTQCANGCSGGSCIADPCAGVNCGSNAYCSSGSCYCSSGYGNCNSSFSDGCEVNLNSNNSNCGYCGNSCPANYQCTSGSCVDTCTGKCQNYCSGETRYFSSPCSAGNCGIYQTENCNNSDGYYCNGNTKEYRDYYCSLNGCNYSPTASANCDSSDLYGNWEYYCSGNDRRQHRKFYDYSCSSSSCNLASSNYIDDSLVETCMYACLGSAPSATCNNGCSGTLSLIVNDRQGTALQNAVVYVDSTVKGSTDSQGKLSIPALSDSCGKTFSIRVASAKGTDCGTKTAVINYGSDSSHLYFVCKDPMPKMSLGAVPGTFTYIVGETVNFSVAVLDELAIMLTNVGIGIKDPLKNQSISNNVASFPWTYSTTASKTGTSEFTFTAAKQGYESDYAKVSLLVEPLPSLRVVVKGYDGNSVSGAKVLLDSSLAGTTDSSGIKKLSVLKGPHSVEVQCASGKSCGKQALVAISGESRAEFGCGCSGDLLVGVFTKENNFPIANVYVYIDGAEKSLTNPIGYLYLKDSPYGYHDISIGMKIKNNENDPDYQTKYSSANVNFAEDKQEVLFYLDLSGNITASEKSTLGTQGIVTSSEIRPQEFGELVGALIIVTILAFGTMGNQDYTEKCGIAYKNSGQWPAEYCRDRMAFMVHDTINSAAIAAAPVEKFAAYAGSGAVKIIEKLPAGSRFLEFTGGVSKFVYEKTSYVLLKVGEGVGFKVINLAEEIIAKANAIKGSLSVSGNAAKIGGRTIAKDEFYQYAARKTEEAIKSDLGEIFVRQLDGDLATQGIGKLAKDASIPARQGNTLGTVLYTDSKGVTHKVSIDLTENLRNIKFNSLTTGKVLGETEDLVYLRDDFGTYWNDAKTGTAREIYAALVEQAPRNNSIFKSLTGKPTQGIFTVPKGTLSEAVTWGDNGVAVTLRDLEQQYGVKFIEMNETYGELDKAANLILKSLESSNYGGG